MKNWLSLLASSVCVLFCATFTCTEAAELPLWALVGAETVIGKGAGSSTGYETINLFLATPLIAQQMLPFFNQRVHWINSNQWAANSGIGMRWIFGERIVGANLYYDYRHVIGGSFNQVGVGIESLGSIVQFRANGYFPIGAKSHHSKPIRCDDYIGGFFTIRRHFRFAFAGGNAEIEFHRLTNSGFRFYAAGGPYFLRHGGLKDTWGGYVRAGIDYWRYVRLEGMYSSDRLFHNCFQGVFKLMIPFGIIHDFFWNTIMQPVVRRDLIYTESRCCWIWNF